MSDPITELFQTLQDLVEADNHESAVGVCDQILAAAPGDTDALHTKVVSLIELSKIEEALQVLESTPALSECTFERAYCLYSLYREESALELLMPGGANPTEARELQLAGQILYRQGKASQAAELFREAEAVGGESAELSTNILAALVSAGKGDEALEYARSSAEGGGADGDGDGSQFELFYNHACAAIATGALGLAKTLLERAIEVCRETLSAEDYTEEEVEVELGVLTAQSAFVDQTLGDLPSAEKAYQTLFAFKADLDPAVTAVAANNVLRIRGQRDLFDSWKRCKATLSESLAKKLTPAQRLAFLSNGALLSLAMNKPDQCKELLATISGEFPSSDFPGLVKAALQLRAKQTKKCEEALETAASSASSPAAALLTLAQLQLSQKEPAKALVTLERIEALRGTPGMVGTLVALRERLGDIEGAAACFDGATDPALLRAGARFFAKHGRWPQAAKAHQTCLEANPRDLRALAGLVIASSHYDPAAANEHYSRLEVLCPPPDETDAAMVDAAELEQAALPRTLRSVGASEAAAERQKRQASDEADADGSGGGRLRKKRQRRKKPIYPKGFDPENPSAFPAPDPERWLPKRERSTYRQRKKDKRAGISRGPQGSATGAARVDARATTNMQVLSEAEKAKKKADEEAASRAQAAAEAAAANSARKKGKGKGKAKW